MEQQTIRCLFALLRSAVCGGNLSEAERAEFSQAARSELLAIAKGHDVDHLAVFALKQNALLSESEPEMDRRMLKAVYRYEQLHYESRQLCSALEEAGIPFMPLKGEVLRAYYPEAWMRTSCDIDILVHPEDLERAARCLEDRLHYAREERGTHDISMRSPARNLVELHFDLVEQGRANCAAQVLASVWDNALLHENSAYRYEMTEAFFYFYHIAHMAKHFESGGCGIRPFIDLWILDRVGEADRQGRDALLEKGGLLTFANACRDLCAVWFGCAESNALSLQMQSFVLHGGVYGSPDNRVALQQRRRGGRLRYLLSRVFAPYAKLKHYYPVLEKHPWLTPLMQIRRWLMLLRPGVAKMAGREMLANKRISKEKTDEMQRFLDAVGL